MKIFVVSLFLFFVSFTYSQQYNFINYSVEHGLAQSQVTDICQDNQGYLWIGTESGGLSRFDGINFTNYSMDDGLVDNKVEKLFIDSKGILWVATSEGISKYVEQKFIPYYFPEPLRINDISEFRGHIFMASSTGLIKIIDGDFKRIILDEDTDLYLRSIVNYKDSLLICGSKRGIYYWKDKVFTPFPNKEIGDKNIFDLDIVGDELYISANKFGIYQYNLTTTEIKTPNTGYTRVIPIYADSVSLLGVSIGYGAFSLEKGLLSSFTQLSGLPNNNLKCIFKDIEGNIWIGTDGKGLMKFSGESIISYSTKDGLTSDVVISINQDNKGNFYFGTYDAGLSILKSNGEINYMNQNSGIADNTVWSIAIDQKERRWIGTAEGVTLLDKNNSPLDHPMNGINTKIRSILFVNDSTYLFGGDDGIYVIKNDSLYNIHSDFNIYKLIQLGDFIYSAGTNGLYKFNVYSNFNNYKKIELPENGIKSIAGDHFGNLWIGTENGLFVMDSSEKFIQFQLDPSEYNSKIVLGIIVNQEGDIWVSTMNGVYEIIPKDIQKIQFKILHYGIAEGLINLECNENALFEDNDQNIWIGTSSGLARIDPSKNDILFNVRAPIIHITEIQLFKEGFDYSNYKSIIDSTHGVPSSIVLPYDKNHLTFNFIGINLKDPGGVKYEYRLVGVEDNWSPLTEDNSATYPFLQSGEYDFEVRATNKNNVWSEIARIHVMIMAPFWKTWWFILIVILSIFSLVIIIFQNRIKAIKQKQENERLGYKNRLLFLEQQSLNASMNRHFIFNSLNSIQYFINSSDKLSANKYLSSFAKLIRKNLDSSTANNFIVTLKEEVERIVLYLSLEKMRFQEQFDYSVELSPDLDAEDIEIPSMILQPFVENSIIHGVLPKKDMGNISLKIYEEYGDLIFEVIDDGVGIDFSLKQKKENMDGDHESKGMDITNRRIELLRKLTGENLLIIGPFQMNGEDGACLGTKVIIKMSLGRQK